LTQDGGARLDRPGLGRPGQARRLDELTRRFGLYLADRLLERETLRVMSDSLSGGVTPRSCASRAAARPFVERAAVLAVVLFETGDGA
jgi:hypothetical protein